MTEPLWTDSDWTFPLIEKVYTEIEKIGVGEMKLDLYRNELEIIGSEQMLDAYSSIGMPVFYKHWSFGKHFTRNHKMYSAGMQGLAYEIVINSNPCIAYLMEENTMTMQALVIAHAAFGHNHFFKNNSSFQQWTDASSIIDYLVFARDYISKCEEREGRAEVEIFLDSCHALMSYGVNRTKRPGKLSTAKEKERQRERDEFAQQRVNELFDRLLKSTVKEKEEIFPPEPEENILYFCEKYAPDLKEWQRELIRIVRKISQYFYPQSQTKVMNEGCATYTHYRILTTMHDRGLITDGSYYEFIRSHTNVVFQPGFDAARYSGINPYALGYAMMRDIARVCNNPTEEDRRWFGGKDFVGCGDDMAALRFAWANFRDESFIRQYLSPRVIRDFGFFSVKDNHKEPNLTVSAIHDERGFEQITEALANQYEMHNLQPQLEVMKVDPKARTMTINYHNHRGRALQPKEIPTLMGHLKNLWGGNPVILKDDKGNTVGTTTP